MQYSQAQGTAMPRKPRIYMAGVPVHVVQRGNNRNACFFNKEDYQAYKKWLGEACRRYDVALHAYVLMTNHVHLLMTPGTKESIPKLMQSVGRQYVQYINKRYQRTGTLWEGRYKSSLVQAEPYLLRCYRYIELNPVTAGMVEKPDEYIWSSYHHHAHGITDDLLSRHPLYCALGEGAERLSAYRSLFSTALSPEHVHAIRCAAEFSMPLGNKRFRNEIKNALGRRIGYPKRSWLERE
jgi:putative transposase